ncbi:Hypothetical predicted protein [Mytilus galloprovincialis]|uniref:DNA 3'-5' helicase n=1 Tax=Mytilus galloprovincialis TaxID=29158 RepID=A0A8B6E8T5_MYTGA|nr:Hypothetical predicted protein [Mytilus galloprovincialis]
MASLETLLLRMNSEMSSQYTYLKDKQEQCIKLCQSRDVLAVLPTGYGKTVIIQALPYIGKDSKCCLVINGLNAIIEEQEKRFGDRCINITDEVLMLLEKDDNPDLMHSTKAKDTISRLKNVDLSIRFILSHPENILHPKIKQMLMTEDWSNHMKALITHMMHETHDSLRLVFATEAYGTGIDVPDIKQIIHVGPPNTMETYVQEIGRCGRNGQQATAVLYYNNTDIANALNLLSKMTDATCTK